MRKKSVLAIFASLLVLTTVVFTGCDSKDDGDKAKDENENAVVTASDAPADEETENLGTAAMEAANTEDFAIETPYCTLYYPVQWQEQVRIEAVEGEAYVVQFYGQVEGKEEQHLFDVLFGSAEGTLIGDLKTADGANVSISIVSYAFEFGEEWTEDERISILTMQEDINHVLGKLEMNESFDSIF